MSSHISKKSPIALTYSKIVEGVTESSRSFMFLTPWKYNNDCNVISSRCSLRTALCESICYQAKSEQNVQDPIPRVRHGEAAVMHSVTKLETPI